MMRRFYLEEISAAPFPAEGGIWYFVDINKKV